MTTPDTTAALLTCVQECRPYPVHTPHQHVETRPFLRKNGLGVEHYVFWFRCEFCSAVREWGNQAPKSNVYGVEAA